MDNRVPVLEGLIPNFRLEEVLQVASLTRQYTGIEVDDAGDEPRPVGAIYLKAGLVMTAQDHEGAGREALFRLLALDHGPYPFRVFRLTPPPSVFPEPPLGAIGALLIEASDSAAVPIAEPEPPNGERRVRRQLDAPPPPPARPVPEFPKRSVTPSPNDGDGDGRAAAPPTRSKDERRSRGPFDVEAEVAVYKEETRREIAVAAGSLLGVSAVVVAATLNLSGSDLAWVLGVCGGALATAWGARGIIAEIMRPRR